MQTMTHSSTDGQQEARLVALARMGQTDEIVEYLYAFLAGRAVRLARGFGLDREDLLQEAAMQIVQAMDRALLVERPMAYLVRSAYNRMLIYCRENSSLIRVPDRSRRRGAVVPWVDSLEATVPGTDGLTLADLLPAGGLDVADLVELREQLRGLLEVA